MTSIRFDNIDFEYEKGKPIFRELSFTIDKLNDHDGYIVGLMGDSGCGKTTLIRLLLGIEKYKHGSITSTPGLRDLVISYMPQEPVFFEHLSPLENAKYFKWTDSHHNHYNDQLFSDLSVNLGMKDKLESAKSIKEISGGERQRLALLRALSISPDILILDEPLTGMDEMKKDSFLKTLADLSQENGTLIIYVTHHKSEVELIADEIIYMIKDDKENCVKSVSKNTNFEFFTSNPPTLSALYLTKHPNTNVLPFMKLKDGDGTEYEICHHQDNEQRPVHNQFIDVSIPENTLKFSEIEGLEFTIIKKAGQYALIKLTDSGQIIVVSSGFLNDDHKLKKVYFDGPVKVFLNGVCHNARISFIKDNKYSILFQE